MENNLADKRQVALILRLTVDRQGQLLHGEVVDLEGRSVGRFAGWSGLITMMQAWVAKQEDNSSNFPSNPS